MSRQENPLSSGRGFFQLIVDGGQWTVMVSLRDDILNGIAWFYCLFQIRPLADTLTVNC